MSGPAALPAGPPEANVAPGRALPEPTPAAHALFGDQLALAARYADRLATIGTAHGHVGPREVARLWDRHLGNSAVLTDLLPPGASVVDVGSGAGLPGIPMAIRRPDLAVVLLEPMLRRSVFLAETVDLLHLGSRVTVLRGRAEDPAVMASAGGAAWVTARAVARLDRLARWCLPLLAPGGRLLALKGSSAADEIAEFGADLSTIPVASVDIVRLGAEYHLEPTQVIVVERGVRAESRRRRTT